MSDKSMEFSKEFVDDLMKILEYSIENKTDGGYLEFDVDGTKLGVDIRFTINGLLIN